MPGGGAMSERRCRAWGSGWRGTLLALALAAGSAAPGLAQTAPAAAGKQVGVMTLAMQDVQQVYTVPGRAVAQDQVTVRPRVGGVITAIPYSPGRPIAKGAELFRIDPTTYEAAVQEAEANLASARAAVPQAQAAYGRAEKLLNSGSTQADLEQARATLEQAEASVLAAQAALTQAQAELGWTTITAPIDGVTSVAGVSVGDLVTAGQSDALATITRLDPIEVDMYEPAARLQRIRDDAESGRLKVSENIRVELTLDNGATYSANGTLVAPGTSVSTTTGSIGFRFRFENPERRILPGMFVRGRIELGTIRAILVPQLAATRGRDGKLSVWVARDGKAVKRVLTEDGTSGNSWVATEGVAEGDLLIVNGTTGLAEGAAVTTVPVEIDANGVVTDQTPAGTDTTTGGGAAAPTSE